MEASEKWVSIPGYVGSYEVSSRGRVQSLDRTIHCADGRVRTFRGKVLSPGESSGYPFVNLLSEGQQRSWKVHRLVALAFLPEPCDGQEVRHLDGDRTNNRISNLAWGSRRENWLDSVGHGTAQVAENHYASILREDEVSEIRRRYVAGGVTQQTLAEEFGVGQSHISRVVNHEVRRFG